MDCVHFGHNGSFQMFTSCPATIDFGYCLTLATGSQFITQHSSQPFRPLTARATTAVVRETEVMTRQAMTMACATICNQEVYIGIRGSNKIDLQLITQFAKVVNITWREL